MQRDKQVEITSEMFWWLSKGRPFKIDDQWQIELLEIDYKHGTAKINIKNLKSEADADEQP